MTLRGELLGQRPGRVRVVVGEQTDGEEDIGAVHAHPGSGWHAPAAAMVSGHGTQDVDADARWGMPEHPTRSKHQAHVGQGARVLAG